MRVAHISLAMEYYPGVAATRERESLAALDLVGHDWHVYVLSPDERWARGAVRHESPRGMGWWPKGESAGGRGLAARALTLNFLPARAAYRAMARRLEDEYDVVLARYYPGDVCAWMFQGGGPKTVHYCHTANVAELRRESRLGALTERLTGPLQARGCMAVAGVTPQIAEVEGHRLAPASPRLVLPNGIDTGRVPPGGQRPTGPFKVVMAAGRFQPWHGLDLVLDRVAAYHGKVDFELHLAGALPSALERRAVELGAVVCHGLLGKEGMRALTESADLSLGSMAMDRAGLSQASSLKTRESLSRGLPVAAGAEDPAFPLDFPWYSRLDASWQWMDVLTLARRARAASPAEVASAAREYIDFRPVLGRFVTDLERLFGPRG